MVSKVGRFELTRQLGTSSADASPLTNVHIHVYLSFYFHRNPHSMSALHVDKPDDLLGPLNAACTTAALQDGMGVTATTSFLSMTGSGRSFRLSGLGSSSPGADLHDALTQTRPHAQSLCLQITCPHPTWEGVLLTLQEFCSRGSSVLAAVHQRQQAQVQQGPKEAFPTELSQTHQDADHAAQLGSVGNDFPVATSTLPVAASPKNPPTPTHGQDPVRDICSPVRQTASETRQALQGQADMYWMSGGLSPRETAPGHVGGFSSQNWHRPRPVSVSSGKSQQLISIAHSSGDPNASQNEIGRGARPPAQSPRAIEKRTGLAPNTLSALPPPPLHLSQFSSDPAKHPWQQTRDSSWKKAPDADPSTSKVEDWIARQEEPQPRGPRPQMVVHVTEAQFFSPPTTPARTQLTMSPRQPHTPPGVTVSSPFPSQRRLATHTRTTASNVPTNPENNRLQSPRSRPTRDIIKDLEQKRQSRPQH